MAAVAGQRTRRDRPGHQVRPELGSARRRGAVGVAGIPRRAVQRNHGPALAGTMATTAGSHARNATNPPQGLDTVASGRASSPVDRVERHRAPLQRPNQPAHRPEPAGHTEPQRPGAGVRRPAPDLCRAGPAGTSRRPRPARRWSGHRQHRAAVHGAFGGDGRGLARHRPCRRRMAAAGPRAACRAPGVPDRRRRRQGHLDPSAMAVAPARRASGLDPRYVAPGTRVRTDQCRSQ
ncbi:hypothetical protein BSG18_57410 [Pseudomonas ogarae]|nr:hypothetical protein BSG18_57410 [Pseudomonas ogarae]